MQCDIRDLTAQELDAVSGGGPLTIGLGLLAVFEAGFVLGVSGAAE